MLRAAPSLLAASVILGMAGLWMFVNPQKLAARAQREIPEFTEFAAGMVDSNLGPTRHDHMIKDLQADLQQEHAPIVTDLPTPVRTDELEGWNVMHWENRPVTEVFLDDHATSLELFVVRRADFPTG